MNLHFPENQHPQIFEFFNRIGREGEVASGRFVGIVL